MSVRETLDGVCPRTLLVRILWCHLQLAPLAELKPHVCGWDILLRVYADAHESQDADINDDSPNAPRQPRREATLAARVCSAGFFY